ncbi:MAG: glycosyltransferase family 9 protein [Bdellovibrionales bacterium]|nr:glycosyltransferase family 9 protein [Bdellovibrionales bacterium]
MAQIVYQTAFIGDLLLSIPLILQLRKRHPGAPIHLVCRKGFGSFFSELSLVERVFEVDKNEGNDSYRRLLKDLSSERYDCVWCVHESIRSALVVRRIKAQKRVGFSHWWNSGFFDLRVKRPLQLPEVLRQLALLASLDQDLAAKMADLKQYENPTALSSWDSTQTPAIPIWASMDLMEKGILGLAARDKIAAEARSQRSQLGLESQNYVVMAPGSVWPTKRWTLAGYSELVKELTRRNFGVVLTGSKQERDLCEQIALAEPSVKNWAGRTSLWSTFALMTQSSFFVGNDSGASHLAVCASIPVIAQFGPTTLKLGYRPWSDRAQVVQENLKCRPCGKHGARVCPLGTHECMERIKSQHVLMAIERMGLIKES